MTIDKPGLWIEPPTFEHVMIDIETMSLHPHRALILSVGMIEFDPDPIAGLVIGAKQLLVLDLSSQLMQCRRVDASTQEWWAKQSVEAARHWRFPTATILPEGAMMSVRLFCAGKKRVWANGTQFDLSNLVDLGADNNVEELWQYRAPRDMRSFVEETPATRLVPVDQALDIRGVEHEPVYDCEIQAWKVWAHWQDQ